MDLDLDLAAATETAAAAAATWHPYLTNAKKQKFFAAFCLLQCLC